MASTSSDEWLRPHYPVVTHELPSAADLVLGRTLADFLSLHVPVEDAAELKRRRQLLEELFGLFSSWVRDTCLTKGVPEAVADQAGGLLFTSGSYRLGVHEPGADVDTICVIPGHCTREDFFSTFREKLENHPSVANFKAVPEAFVPIMTFDLGEVNIDLLCAVLPLNSIPQSLDISDNSILDNVDQPTMQSLNGPRVTNLIIRMVRSAGWMPGATVDEEQAKTRYDNFLCVLRCVRIWAKKRKIYSNKLGYLGGINFNIMLALVCQMYPRANAARLLVLFFDIYARWQWPQPVVLCEPFTIGSPLDAEVWNPDRVHHARSSVMPIITPAYPAFNSSANVSDWTLAVMREEFQRADRIVKRIEANAGARMGATDGDSDAEDAYLRQSRDLWEELIQPSDFFARPEYNNFLGINITAASKEQHSAWSGYVLARLRKLPEHLGTTLPLVKIHLLPQEFEHGIAATPSGNVNTSVFLAFVHDKKKDKNLDFRHTLSKFRADLFRKFSSLAEGMDIAPVYFKWKRLPPFVFESLGGKPAAADLRKKLKVERAAAEAAQAEAAAEAADDPMDADSATAVAAAKPEGLPSADMPDAAPECFTGLSPDQQEALLALVSVPEAAVPSTPVKREVPSDAARGSGPERRRRVLELLESYGVDGAQGEAVLAWLDQDGASRKRRREDTGEGTGEALPNVAAEDKRPLWLRVEECVLPQLGRSALFGEGGSHGTGTGDSDAPRKRLHLAAGLAVA